MTPPLVLLGVDAGDPDFLRRWAAEGHLPTIASLMSRGSWGRTAGAELVSEHGTWASIFSGVSRGQHGYHYFRQLRPGTYELETTTPPYDQAPPFWSHLREHPGPAVAVIDAPDTCPLRGLRGLQLANWATHANWDPDHFAPASEPPGLITEVRARFGDRLSVIENPEAGADENRRVYRRLLEHVAIKGELCRYLLSRERFDLIVVVFAESHVAGHQFWPYAPEVTDRVDPAETDLRHAIRGVYQAIDQEIGRLLETLPPHSNVLVLSSVGLDDDFPTTGLIEAALRAFGYESRSPPGPISLRPLDLARRLLPESWRVALSRFLSRGRRERLLADVFRRGSDWSRTTAFAVPGAYTSFVRVNLRGREPEGVVEPGAPYLALLDRVEQDLSRLVDPATSEAAVTRLSRSRDLFGENHHPALPDLFIDWKSGRYMERLSHPGGDLRRRQPDFFRRSDHSAHGFFAAAGPDVAPKGRVADVDVLDLAPTFLELMGRRQPERMTGKTTPWVGRDELASHRHG